MTTDMPKQLYKILSLRHWQATQSRKALVLSSEDDAFIHFSMEDQLDRILTKYWSDKPQYVVLKIDTNKLQGNLVYETNPGGSAKYYHLYQGHIPFDAIVEAKVVYQKPIDASCCKLLDIVQAGDPVLRQVARDLSVEEILSPEIQELIQAMKATMRAAPGVGLAAPQIGKSIQLAVIEDVEHSHLTPEQIEERGVTVVPFHVIINPRIYLDETKKAEFFETCLSISELMGVVPRALSVRVECLNEKAEPIVIHAKGWYARILQHEIDHLNGTLYIDRVLLPTLMSQENYMKHWKGKKVTEIVAGLAPAEVCCE